MTKEGKSWLEVARGKDEFQETNMRPVETWNINIRPKLYVPPKQYEEMVKTLVQTMVAGFAGDEAYNRMKFRYIYEHLRDLWPNIPQIKFIASNHGWFLIKVQNDADVEYIMIQST